MKETKEMMIKLPMVTATSYEELNKAKTYPQSGRYIVKMDNGDIVVADVTLRPVEQGEARSIDEDTQSTCTCFVGQPVVLDPDEWTLAIDLENAKLAYEADRKRMEEQMREVNERHEAEMAEQKEKCEAACHETEENCDKLINHFDTIIIAYFSASVCKRRFVLWFYYKPFDYLLIIQVFPIRNTPKRFAQGEWVSGKTLTEIIRTLTAGKKED